MLYKVIELKNLLFVCGKNKLRSPTAEAIFSSWQGVSVDSAGVSSDANVVVSLEQVQWADVIFVMEKSHCSKLKSKFPSAINGKHVVCLDVPDKFSYMQQELVDILNKKVSRYIK